MKLIRQLLCSLVLISVGSMAASAQSVNWKGHTWTLNNGSPIGSSGPGQISGSASNITVDGSGFLHLKISGSGSSAKGSEMYSTDKLGFGSIYYVFQGAITAMQPQVVLAGFTYGPAAGVGVDGENELDIEFSKWNNTAGNINGDFAFYPSTGHRTGVSSFGDDFLINLGGSNVNTCRIDWNSTKVTASIWTGVVSPTAPTSTALKTDTFNGNTSTIPQSPCPMLFNLWTFGALPTQALDIAVQDFQFIPQGSTSSSTSSSSTSSSSSSGGTLTAGVHTLTPQCATGSRLDDSNGGGTANGNPVQIWTATGGSAQNWNFASVGTNAWNAAVMGPYCLDDMGGAQGVQIAVWSCNGGNNQRWTSAASGSNYTFKSGSGLCMDVNGAGSANGTKVQNYVCNNSNAQLWAVH